MTEQTQTQTQTPKYIHVRASCTRMTNTGYMKDVMFSLKKRKFIKGRIHWGAETTIEYRLLPGTYLRFTWSWWNKEDPPNMIVVELVRYKHHPVGDYQVCEILGAVYFRFADEDANKLPKIVRDFYNAAPGYHKYPSIDFNRVYSEEEVQEIVKLCTHPSTHVVIGEEHD